MASNPISIKKSPGAEKREPRIAGNIHGCAILGIGATSQMLPLYSNVQNRARFVLCNERVNAYTLH
jgi:hypothetical protein